MYKWTDENETDRLDGAVYDLTQNCTRAYCAMREINFKDIAKWLRELQLRRKLDEVADDMCHKGEGGMDNSEEIKQYDKLKSELQKIQDVSSDEFYEPFV